MKKLLSLLLSVAMVASLAACGSKEPSKSGSSASNSGDGAKKWKIATVVKESSDPWFIRMEEGVKQYAGDTETTHSRRAPRRMTPPSRSRSSMS